MLFYSVTLFSQSTNYFNFNIDFSRYRYDTSTTFLEVYYSFLRSKFKLIKNNNDLTGSAIITFKIFSKSTNNPIQVSRWKTPFKVSDPSSLEQDKALLGLKSFTLPSDQYYFIAQISDEYNPLISDSLRFDINISSPIKNKVSISDPELCISIRNTPKDEKNIFYKNTLEVIPNPNLIFGKDFPIIYVYSELYGLNNIKNDNFSFNLDIYSVSGKGIKSIQKQKTKRYESSVEVNQINCADLPSGPYILRCSIVDGKDSLQKSLSYKKFYIFNPQIKASEDSAGFIADEFDSMNESDINMEFQLAKYLEKRDPPGVKKLSENPDLKEKKSLLSGFWKTKSDDGSVNKNNFRKMFLNSLQYVNKAFRTGQRPGWKTDRGRIYLTYGPPSNYERYPNQNDERPYEIWYYDNLEGGAIFVFIDLSTMGDYRLVHSTYRDEIREDNWKRLVK
jgi:GWxTD domain-containing protein